MSGSLGYPKVSPRVTCDCRLLPVPSNPQGGTTLLHVGLYSVQRALCAVIYACCEAHAGYHTRGSADVAATLLALNRQPGDV